MFTYTSYIIGWIVVSVVIKAIFFASLKEDNDTDTE